MKEIKECPCCNSKAVHRKATWALLERIRCQNNLCQCEIVDYGGINVVEAWNHRPHRPWDEEALKELDNILSEYLFEHGRGCVDIRKTKRTVLELYKALTKTFQIPEMGEIEFPKPQSSNSDNEFYNDGFEDGQTEMLTACKEAVGKKKKG